jgi:hypothetical protein
MAKLGSLTEKIRSKNAGPFWLTIDIFCADRDCFDRISATLDTARVASLFKTAPETMKRFDIAELHVIKFSLPRPSVQGTRSDRDMHGAAWATLLEDLEI